MSNVVLSALGLGSKAIRISEEVERLLRMTAWIRQCLETELASGLGTATQKGIDSKTLTKWKDVVTSFKQLAEAKVQLDKNSKALADAMSEEDEQKAVEAYVKAMEPKKRENWLRRMSEWHAISVVPS